MTFKLNKTREQLAEMFVQCLEEDSLPWHAVWNTYPPQNAVTSKPYRGLNNFNLSIFASIKGYKDPRWCTFKQATDKGWHVKKGEKSVPVEFWSFFDKKTKKYVDSRDVRAIIRDDPDREKDFVLSSRTYSVFNADQIEGIPELVSTQRVGLDLDAIRAQRDTLLTGMNLKFKEEGNEAYYSPTRDIVVIPPGEYFHDTYGYICTFLHECGHATGHKSRLDRDLSGRFGSESYAKEELRAEIASAFTAQALGLDFDPESNKNHLDNHKAYIQSWIKAIKEEPNELFAAIKDAEKISDYLIEKGQFEIVRTPEELKPKKKQPSLAEKIQAAERKQSNTSRTTKNKSRQKELQALGR